jgi:NADH-quinone oxidoreductase subunit H
VPQSAMILLDQLFVQLKHWMVSAAPVGLQSAWSALLSASAIIATFGALFALTTWLERKGLARIQNRYGPNRVGPFGLLQPLADGLKALTKEDVIPTGADRLVYFLAPLTLVVPVFLSLAVLPMGRNMVALELDSALLFFFAVGAATELAVFMAGWASRNKYSLLGAMRAMAQMISYEVPLVLSAVTVVMVTGTLSTVRIVEGQGGYTGWLPNWHLLTPWGVAGFILFVVAGLAESNRAPFDLPEGESEIIAGYYVEYSGFKFALFFLGEYIGMFAVSGLAITLFLGGWHAPLPFLQWLPSWLWFFAKMFAMIGLFIWIRGTLPRLRMDQLMRLAWKFMLPMALLNLVVAGIWHFMSPGIVRWLACGALVLGGYAALGNHLFEAGGLRKRTYVYAD